MTRFVIADPLKTVYLHINIQSEVTDFAKVLTHMSRCVHRHISNQ